MTIKRKIPTTIYLTQRQQTLLRELSDRSKVPVAEYIRQGVELILKKNHHQLPGQLSFLLEAKESSAKKGRSSGKKEESSD